MNLLIGCVGIYCIMRFPEYEAFYFVILAGLFDFLDGFTARLLKIQSELGKQLDSLSDLVSFGMLPAFYVLKELEGKTPFFWVALLIAVFSAVRLAIFNLDDTQQDSFKGLPTPANAIMLTALAFSPVEIYDTTLIGICLFSCLMLVSPVRLIALKFKTIGWKGNEPRWLLLLGSGVLIAGFQMAAIPFLIPYYIACSVVSNLIFKS